MSGTSLSEEFAKLVEAFDYGWDDLQWFTVNAMKSAFIGFDERLELINGVIKPGFATARALSDADQRPLWNKGDFFGTLYKGQMAK